MSYKELIMKKLISIILVFGILNITFSGCTSSKLLSVEETSQMQPDKKYLILHNQTKTYMLYNYEFTDTKLKGELTSFSKRSGNNINVYTPLNFELKADEKTSQFFEMDKLSINKIAYIKNEPVNTVLLVFGGLLGLFGIIVAGVVIDMNTNGINMSY